MPARAKAQKTNDSQLTPEGIAQLSTDPVMNQLFQGSKPKYIISVHPKEFSLTLMRSGTSYDKETKKWKNYNRHTYTLKAAPKGSYSTPLDHSSGS